MIDLYCQCGSVHLRVRGKPVAQFWCHCGECQRAHGAAYVAEALYPASGVEIVRGQTVTLTVITTPRLSCARCGARLFAELDTLGMRGLNGYLLPEGMFTPTLHINCGEAVAPVRDGLPHYRTKPTDFGGDGAEVDW